ncbi:MAG: putative Ig domain-containing protein [Gammaproteobacteria bacterium]
MLAGSVGDGPVTGATVEIWSTQGRLIGSMKSDNTASFNSSIRVRRSSYPLLLKVRGGIDLVTGSAPDFQLVSVMPDRHTRQVNINPFSTLIVGITQSMPGGINANNIRAARKIVTDKLGFGLDPDVIADPISTRITDRNIANLVKASEAMGEMVRRTRDLIATTGRKTSGDAVLAAIAVDLQDGSLDGQGTRNSDPDISAVAKVVSGQVLVEALANTLKVGGIIATPVIDQSIEATRPGISSDNLTQSVRITDGMLEQTRTALAAARAVDSSAEVAAIESIVSKISAGTMPANIATVLPADASRTLDNAVLLSSTADETQLAAVNATGVQTGSDNHPPAVPLPTEPVTTAPVTTAPITTDPSTTGVSSRRTWSHRTSSRRTSSRTPVTTETVATEQVAAEPVTTTPVATEPVATKPVTTTPVTTEPVAAEPVTTTPVTTEPVTSDPATTGPVTTVPVNNAPVISGSPSRSVTAGTAYSFQPVASDSDRDTLSFSIIGKPAWASFNTATGRLSGTPGDSDAGTYSNIVIAVTDRTDTASLQAFTISVVPAQNTVGSFNLSWTAPVARADGTPLSLVDIGGYRIYYGTSSGNYPDTIDVSDGSAQSATVNNLPVGTYHIVMTTYDSNGLESARSAEVAKVAR